MKKLISRIIVVAMIIFGFSSNANAQIGESLFGREKEQTENRGGFPGLPPHGEDGNQPAPIGSGAAMLIGFGAAYALAKKNKK